MHIQSSSISMQSSHLRASVQQQQASLTVWKETPANTAPTEEQNSLTPKSIAQNGLAIQPTNNTATEKIDEDSKLSPELLKMKQAIESLMAWMSGRTVKIKLFSEADMQPKTDAFSAHRKRKKKKITRAKCM